MDSVSSSLSLSLKLLPIISQSRISRYISSSYMQQMIIEPRLYYNDETQIQRNIIAVIKLNIIKIRNSSLDRSFKQILEITE